MEGSKINGVIDIEEYDERDEGLESPAVAENLTPGLKKGESGVEEIHETEWNEDDESYVILKQYEDVSKSSKSFWLSRFFVKFYCLIIPLVLAL